MKLEMSFRNTNRDHIKAFSNENNKHILFTKNNKDWFTLLRYDDRYNR